MNLREFESSRAEFEENKVSTITRLQRDAVKESGIGLLPEHCSYFEEKYHFLCGNEYFKNVCTMMLIFASQGSFCDSKMYPIFPR